MNTPNTVPMLPDGSIEWQVEQVAGGTLFASDEGLDMFQDLGLADKINQYGANKHSMSKYPGNVLGDGFEGTVIELGGVAVKGGAVPVLVDNDNDERALMNSRAQLAVHEGLDKMRWRYQDWGAPEQYFVWSSGEGTSLSGMEYFPYPPVYKTTASWNSDRTRKVVRKAVKKAGLGIDSVRADTFVGNLLVNQEDKDSPKYVVIDTNPMRPITFDFR